LNLAPLYALRLITSRLELRLGSHDELVSLAHLAKRGIHPPEEMPFAVAWTDRVDEEDFVETVVEYHEGTLRDWRPDDWRLNLLVFVNGGLAGSQSIAAEDMATRREVHTGSWLGAAHQRQGIGTEMRVAVLELAFRGLGAKTAHSGAIVGNDASKRVSEKLGYRVTGMSTVSPRGVPLQHYDLCIDRATWQPPMAVEILGLEKCLPLFGLSESS
jgi:RimJ/RimL family protein N-acetyltransferase